MGLFGSPFYLSVSFCLFQFRSLFRYIFYTSSLCYCVNCHMAAVKLVPDFHYGADYILVYFLFQLFVTYMPCYVNNANTYF